MLPALPNVAILRFSGLSILPRFRGILWGLLGQAAARGGVSMPGPIPRGGLWVSPPLRRRGIAAPSDLNLTLQRIHHKTRSPSGRSKAPGCMLQDNRSAPSSAPSQLKPSSSSRLRQAGRQTLQPAPERDSTAPPLRVKIYVSNAHDNPSTLVPLCSSLEPSLPYTTPQLSHT